MELERKYPPPDSFFNEPKENDGCSDTLLFEFWSCLTKTLTVSGEREGNALIEKESSLASLIKIQNEALRKEEEALELTVQEAFDLLGPETKVIFPH